LLNNTFNPNPAKGWLVAIGETHWQVFCTAAALVSLPVFIEAPLVRQVPELCLALTTLWVGISYFLYRHPPTQIWGDLLFGFSWSWLAGAIYWGWWRWNPELHLPIEAIGLPIVLWLCWQGKGKVGGLFYLGSLLGTAATDGYIYVMDLVKYWQQLMIVEPALATPLLQAAIAQVQTPRGTVWAVVLVSLLLTLGIICLGHKKNHWYAFSGAVLTTIVVDSLFLVVATVTQSL
jgi:Protein of unknown function (DUF3120)